MKKQPSNTREQCAYDSGAFKRRMLPSALVSISSKTWAEIRDARNPHKKGSQEHQFWNEGFDSAQL